MPIKRVSREHSEWFHYVGANYHTICGEHYYTWSAPRSKYQAESDVDPPGKVLCDVCQDIAIALFEVGDRLCNK